MSFPSLVYVTEKYDVKPQDIGAVCGVSAMPTKWAKCSDVAGNERILAAERQLFTELSTETVERWISLFPASI